MLVKKFKSVKIISEKKKTASVVKLQTGWHFHLGGIDCLIRQAGSFIYPEDGDLIRFLVSRNQVPA